MNMIIPSADEIREMADKASDAAHNPKYFSMSYEQGIAGALGWVLGEIASEEIL